MKKAIAILLMTLVLSACSFNPSTEEIQRLAEARDSCNDLGGVFVQWETGLGAESYRCDFDQREDQ